MEICVEYFIVARCTPTFQHARWVVYTVHFVRKTGSRNINARHLNMLWIGNDRLLRLLSIEVLNKWFAARSIRVHWINIFSGPWYDGHIRLSSMALNVHTIRKFYRFYKFYIFCEWIAWESFEFGQIMHEWMVIGHVTGYIHFKWISVIERNILADAFRFSKT